MLWKRWRIWACHLGMSSNRVSVTQQYNSLSVTSAFTVERRKLTPCSMWSEPVCILFACVFFPSYSVSRISTVLAQTLARISLDEVSQCNFCFTVEDWSLRVALSECLRSCSSSCRSRALCWHRGFLCLYIDQCWGLHLRTWKWRDLKWS